VPRKGAQHLIAAAIELKRRELLQHYHFHIYGKGELFKPMQQQIKQHKLETAVTLHGFVDEAQKPVVLSAADIAIYPATGGEAFGIVLLEGMASGSLTLGGDNPGYRSVLDFAPDSLFNPIDPQATVQLFERLRTDSQLFNQLYKIQQDKIEDYDVNRVGLQFVELYREARVAHERLADIPH
jgi:phosphatidylinositol alpha-mannosyltransferase